MTWYLSMNDKAMLYGACMHACLEDSCNKWYCVELSPWHKKSACVLESDFSQQE